jgi:hypothetical protein
MSCLKLIFVFSFSVMKYACKSQQDKTSAENHLQPIDTIYQAVNFDTVSSSQPLEMYNEPYDLTIQKYSLNDSAVINPVYRTREDEPDKMDTLLSISHNQTCRILLKKFDEIVLEKTIDKSVFADSLSNEILIHHSLYLIEFVGVRTNRLYFNLGIGIPSTGIIYKAKAAIFYRTSQRGEFSIWDIHQPAFE